MSAHLLPDSTIARLLWLQAQERPDAPALVAEGCQPLTYAELMAQLGAVRSRLNEAGIGRNDRVALLVPDGPQMAVAFLAVSACATCAPLNPAYRGDQIEFYLTDLKAKALILFPGLESPAESVAQAQGLPVFELKPTGSAAGLFELSGGHAALPAQGGWASPDDVALMLHTSGTTARPKLVPLTQRNLCASATNIRRTLRLSEQDRCLNIMPLFHIHGLVAATLSTLASGASLVCTTQFDPESFFSRLETFRPTWYTAVPTMHQAILTAAPAHLELIARCSLRFVRSSSSSLPPTVMAALERTFEAPVIEAYGMTEAAHQMASNPLPPAMRKPGTVGLAAGPEVAVMGENSADLLGQGEIGEVVIRGENVTPGYSDNPKANRTAFVDGWFRTGDQGRLDGDGYLVLTGRLKELINRGGEKIAPREVDEALLEHPEVAQAVTFAVSHVSLGEDVAAAVVLRSTARIGERELRRHLFDRLADHMVPTRVLIVDAIPKGPTGKIQRLGLAAILADRLRAEFEAPEGPFEELLAAIWAEVLHAAAIGRNDNFFSLGGDSISATGVTARVRAALDVDLPLGAVFREPVLTDQAQVIADTLVAEIEDLSEEEAQQHLLSGSRQSSV